MYHWHCTLMAINPAILSNHLAEIVQTVVSDLDPEAGKMLTITVNRLSDSKRGSVSLTRGYDPDGEWSEELAPDGLPKNIHACFADFGVQSAQELVRPDKLRVNGVYAGDYLVAISPLICNGLLPEHSFEPWHWDDQKSAYIRECSIASCSAVEVAKNLAPSNFAQILDSTGKPLGNDRNTCDHIWGQWITTTDQFGLHLDQFRYECTCQICQSKWRTVSLSAVVAQR